jgi:hypothetical protein
MRHDASISRSATYISLKIGSCTVTGRKIFERRRDLGIALGVTVIEVHHQIAVEAVEAEDAQHHEIGVHDDQTDGVSGPLQ